MSDLLGDSATKREMFLTLLFSLLVFGYTFADLVFIQADIVSAARESHDWEVGFDENITIVSDSAILSDDEKREFKFQIDESELRIGAIRVFINYSETSGLLFDNPDTVSGDIHTHGLEAQWLEENNTLSGTSNDGSTIELFLRTYPDFDGLSRQVSAPNEYQALDGWREDGWGVGELTVEIELDTSSPQYATDDDEEITVTVNIIRFEAIAELVEE